MWTLAQFSSVQSLSRVWLVVTPWPAVHQAALSITISQSLLKLLSIEWYCHPTSCVVPFSSCLQSFPASGSFPGSQFFPSGGQSIGISASASILPINIQDWFPLGLTDLISLLCKGLSRVFSNTIVQKHQVFSAQLVNNPPIMRETWVQSLGWEDPWRRERPPTPVLWPGEFHGLLIVHGVTKSWTRLSYFPFHSLLYGPTLTSVCDYWKNQSFDNTDLFWQSNVSSNEIKKDIPIWMQNSKE